MARSTSTKRTPPAQAPADIQHDNVTPKKARRSGRTTELAPDVARQKFASSLARYGNIALACRAARISRQTAYRWREESTEFKAAWEDALRDSVNVLEREAFRRAVKGTDKPVYQQGGQVGTVREYSDTLLIFLLKGAAPEKYRERVQTEHTGEQRLIVSYVNDWRGQGSPEQANTTEAPPMLTDGGDEA